MPPFHRVIVVAQAKREKETRAMQGIRAYIIRRSLNVGLDQQRSNGDSMLINSTYLHYIEGEAYTFGIP